MKLSSEIISPLEILSESEIFFLKYMIPAILLMPWVIFAIYKILKWMSQFFNKSAVNDKFVLDNQWLSSTVKPKERAPLLSDLEKLALTDPRKALNELSRYCRISYLKEEYLNPSLEFWLRKVEHAKSPRFLDITSENLIKEYKTVFSPLFSEIILSSYQKKIPSTEQVVLLIQKVRKDLRGKSDGI